MAEKIIYTCSKCDAQFSKWSGRCLECGAWGSLDQGIKDQGDSRHILDQREVLSKSAAKIIDLNQIKASNKRRLDTGFLEVDRVLGGGIVPGSLLLLGGEPGIGKSTIVAQLADALAKKHKLDILYISGEESAAQVKYRLERLGCDLDRIKFIGETGVEKIVGSALNIKPALVIVDSIQTVYSTALPSEAGSLNQIRASAVKFLELAKSEQGPAVFLVGHITKDGQIAGPKSLEHIVDTVIYLENESIHNYSLLRVVKNRFGSVNELGVLEMTGSGFREVSNPTAIFLESNNRSISGTVVGAMIEGSRPFLVDIQALVTKTIFGYPQRKASGFDLNRLQVLTAVLSKKQKLNLASSDVIVNVAGGLRISDPALDLSVCLAIVSSWLNTPIDQHLLVLGEVGLGGEVRGVAKIDLRLKEAAKLGFTRAIIPDMKVETKGLELIKVKTLSQAIDLISDLK